MPLPTTAKGMLGHFPCSTDPPTVFQGFLPLTVWLLTSLSLYVILAAKAGGGGARGGAVRHMILWEGRGGGRGAGGRDGGSGGARGGRAGPTTRRVTGTERHKRTGGWRRRDIEELLERMQDVAAGGEYHAIGGEMEDNADDSDKVNSNNTSVTAGEVGETTGGAGG